MSQAPEPQGLVPNPERIELHVMRVANGWIVQPTSLAAPLNPETGQPYGPNSPSAMLVVTNPMDLCTAVLRWAQRQEPLREAPSALAVLQGRFEAAQQEVTDAVSPLPPGVNQVRRGPSYQD